jgi:hypothetical protein
MRSWGDALRDAADPTVHAGTLQSMLNEAAGVPVALRLRGRRIRRPKMKTRCIWACPMPTSAGQGVTHRRLFADVWGAEAQQEIHSARAASACRTVRSRWLARPRRQCAASSPTISNSRGSMRLRSAPTL